MSLTTKLIAGGQKKVSPVAVTIIAPHQVDRPAMPFSPACGPDQDPVEGGGILIVK
jgi:hypothetical protein